MLFECCAQGAAVVEQVGVEKSCCAQGALLQHVVLDEVDVVRVYLSAPLARCRDGCVFVFEYSKREARK